MTRIASVKAAAPEGKWCDRIPQLITRQEQSRPLRQPTLHERWPRRLGQPPRPHVHRQRRAQHGRVLSGISSLRPTLRDPGYAVMQLPTSVTAATTSSLPGPLPATGRPVRPHNVEKSTISNLVSGSHSVATEVCPTAGTCIPGVMAAKATLFRFQEVVASFRTDCG
jgi:hypothetical protein